MSIVEFIRDQLRSGPYFSVIDEQDGDAIIQCNVCEIHERYDAEDSPELSYKQLCEFALADMAKEHSCQLTYHRETDSYST